MTFCSHRNNQSMSRHILTQDTINKDTFNAVLALTTLLATQQAAPRAIHTDGNCVLTGLSEHRVPSARRGGRTALLGAGRASTQRPGRNPRNKASSPNTNSSMTLNDHSLSKQVTVGHNS